MIDERAKLKKEGSNMIKPSEVYNKNETNWVSRFILDEVVTLPLCRSEDDMQYIYSISNETGARIFQLLDGKHSVGDIQEIIKREFKGSGKVIEREVSAFLRDLLSVKLIEKLKQGKPGRVENLKSRSDIRCSMLAAHLAGKKKPYKTPEITKVKMQPEQAVLSCCTSASPIKSWPDTGSNWCGTMAQTLFCTCDGDPCEGFSTNPATNTSAISS